jgi:hypothetical protein
MSARGSAVTIAAPHPTYGELMDAARQQVVVACHQLERDAFEDSQHALAAVDARGRLLRSLAANARAILGPVQVDAVRGQRPTRHSPDPRDPRTVATLQWLDRLQSSRLVDATTTAQSNGIGPVAGSLRAAGVAVDAATDLALTHYEGAGVLRADGSGLLAGLEWGDLAADCLRIVAIAAPIEPLALRCRQAGLTRAQVDAFLPLDDDLVDQTWVLASAWKFPQAGARDLTVAHPPLRVGDPAAEWTDRMTHVLLEMRHHRDSGRIGVRTLRDVARLGTVISHVLATSRSEDSAAQSHITTQWQALTESLAPLRSTEPANATIRGHVDRMLDLASASRAAGSAPQRDRLVAAIATSTPLMDYCSAIAQDLATTSNDLWLPPKPQRPYLRTIPTARTRASRPVAAPHFWPRPIRAGRPDRSVGMA